MTYNSRKCEVQHEQQDFGAYREEIIEEEDKAWYY